MGRAVRALPLCFRDWRLASRLDRTIVGAFFVTIVPIELVWLLFFAEEEGPGNALLVWPDETIAGAIEAVATTLAVGAALTLTVTLALRWLRGSDGRSCRSWSGRGRSS